MNQDFPRSTGCQGRKQRLCKVWTLKPFTRPLFDSSDFKILKELKAIIGSKDSRGYSNLWLWAYHLDGSTKPSTSNNLLVKSEKTDPPGFSPDKRLLHLAIQAILTPSAPPLPPPTCPSHLAAHLWYHLFASPYWLTHVLSTLALAMPSLCHSLPSFSLPTAQPPTPAT